MIPVPTNLALRVSISITNSCNSSCCKNPFKKRPVDLPVYDETIESRITKVERKRWYQCC
jgi:hypothetical protein